MALLTFGFLRYEQGTQSTLGASLLMVLLVLLAYAQATGSLQHVVEGLAAPPNELMQHIPVNTNLSTPFNLPHECLVPECDAMRSEESGVMNSAPAGPGSSYFSKSKAFINRFFDKGGHAKSPEVDIEVASPGEDGKVLEKAESNEKLGRNNEASFNSQEAISKSDEGFDPISNPSNLEIPQKVSTPVDDHGNLKWEDHDETTVDSGLRDSKSVEREIDPVHSDNTLKSSNVSHQTGTEKIIQTDSNNTYEHTLTPLGTVSIITLPFRIIF